MSQTSDSIATTKAREVLVRRALIIAVIVLVVFVATLQLWSTFLIRNTQVDNTQRAQDTKAAADAALRGTKRIEDCTTPGRKCYDDGQRRTAKAVGDINRVIVLASACAVGLSPALSVDEREARIQRCVINRLSAGR